MVADTHCVKKKKTEIPELRRSLPKGKVDQVMVSLYQKIWGMDLGIPVASKGSGRQEETVRRLARIPYLDRPRWPESIQKFARSIKPLLMEEQRERKLGRKGRTNPMGDMISTTIPR